MNFIEKYEDYKHNEFVMKAFLEAQLTFVVFYVYAIFFLKSIEVYVFIMTMMVGLPIVFNIWINKKRSDKSSLIKKNGKEISVKGLIKSRVKIRREVNKINYIKLDRFYSLFSASMVVILPILTIFFIDKIVELNANLTVFISIVVVILSVIGQILFISVGLTNSKDLLERLKDKGELKERILLERNDKIIETRNLNKISKLIKKGYKYNEDSLRKVLNE